VAATFDQVFSLPKKVKLRDITLYSHLGGLLLTRSGENRALDCFSRVPRTLRTQGELIQFKIMSTWFEVTREVGTRDADICNVVAKTSANIRANGTRDLQRSSNQSGTPPEETGDSINCAGERMKRH
jgi:hypothetical protein